MSVCAWSCGTPVGNAVDGAHDKGPVGLGKAGPAEVDVPLLAGVEDEALKAVALADEVVLAAEDGNELFVEEAVVNADLSEGAEVVVDDPLAVAGFDTVDPTANAPQSPP